MELSAFTYALPEDRIAQYPVKPRDASRLLVLPSRGALCHRRFRELPALLSPGDLLVFNDTRVVPARLLGKRRGGGKAEVLLLRPSGADGRWEAFVRPAKRLKAGALVALKGGGGGVRILEELGEGRRLVAPEDGAEMTRLMRAYGSVPLPPYISREAEAADTRTYQTVYAKEGLSVAAPTAGLHFTPRVLRGLQRRGVETAFLRLDVGPGTFKPVTVPRVEDHTMDSEAYAVPPGTAGRVNAALAEGRRVIAVGTTVTRCLEDQLRRFGRLEAGAYDTDLFILPGFRFRAVSGLLTNFHLPGSTLIMLVSALAGRERVLAAYRQAVAHGYRFYSYGDAMLAWKASA